MADTMNRLELHDVCVLADGKAILNNFSLSLCSGEVAILHGHNGSGKSTALRIASGLLVPQSGARSLTRPDGRAATVTGVWQARPGLVPKLTAAQNFDYLARLSGVSGRALAERRTTLFERLDLVAHHDKAASDLSTGLKMRVAIAIAFAPDADLVILDEVDAVLDTDARQVAGDLARERLNAGGIVLATSHHADFLARFKGISIQLGQGRTIEALQQIPDRKEAA